MNKNYDIMQTFTLSNIPSLDVCVKGALELFQKVKLPEIKIPKKQLLVLGSGNALDVGKILFSDYHAHYADEGTYKQKLKNSKPDIAIIISASGGKHAHIMAKYLKHKKIKIILITNNINSRASKFVGEIIVFPKQREPYTYNTSTYLASIISKTKESPKAILRHVNKLDKLIPKKLSKYDSFYLIVPERFDAARDMLNTKFDELFGSKISGRVFTFEQTKHAKTVTTSRKELFISFGEKNIIFGEKNNRLHIPLPKRAGYATFIATAYYVIGKIQNGEPQYFKQNITKYTKKASKIFKEEIKPIVEGNS